MRNFTGGCFDLFAPILGKFEVIVRSYSFFSDLGTPIHLVVVRAVKRNRS
jgi:hypothetical protein